MKTIISGLGNPILSDDGVGLYVARALQDKINQQEVTVIETSLAGLNLLDTISGYDRAIVVDAIQTRDGKAGQVYRLDPGALNTTRHATSPHDVDFVTALELGKALGLDLPKQIVIFGIEVADATTFSEECTLEVKRAIPVCVNMILRELERDADA